MICSHVFVKTRSIAFIAAAVVALFAAAPAFADNPCKSEDPMDFDEANRRADCGDPKI